MRAGFMDGMVGCFTWWFRPPILFTTRPSYSSTLKTSESSNGYCVGGLCWKFGAPEARRLMLSAARSKFRSRFEGEGRGDAVVRLLAVVPQAAGEFDAGKGHRANRVVGG